MGKTSQWNNISCMFSFFLLTKNLIFSFSPAQVSLASHNSSHQYFISWQTELHELEHLLLELTAMNAERASSICTWKEPKLCIYILAFCLHVGVYMWSNAKQESSSMNYNNNVMCTAYERKSLFVEHETQWYL